MRISPCRAFLGEKHILFDASLFDAPPVHLFDIPSLEKSGRIASSEAGRGEVRFIRCRERELVLRHYRRGGLVRKILSDRYIGLVAAGSRSWREWSLLARMHDQGLPVPRPIAALARMGPLFYSADLITERIPGARPLAEILRQEALPPRHWQEIGATIARFHNSGIGHADLNAFNIVLDEDRAVYLLDFDRGTTGISRLRKRRNLARLQRSLRKQKSAVPFFAFEEGLWQSLLQGYRQGTLDDSERRNRSDPPPAEKKEDRQ